MTKNKNEKKYSNIFYEITEDIIHKANFDEEIQKFQPSLEVEDAEDAIYNNDVPDITDLISQILSGKNTDK